jgi:protein O-mannosyl-transferase
LKNGTPNSSSDVPIGGALIEVWRERKPLLAGIILFGLVLWTFLPAVDGEFVVYDDPDYVSANAQVQHGLTWENVLWAFSSTEAANWHPLTWLSHMLDCQIYGLAPWGHHLTSLLLHALNTLLLFVLLRRMTGATGRAFVVALLFGLHPLRVESAAWVAERKDVLSTAFWMLTLWAYVRYANPECGHREQAAAKGGDAARSTQHASRSTLHASRFYVLSLLCFVLGLMSKAMLVTVPCVMLLLDYWPLRRWPARSIRSLAVEKIPFFMAALASAAATWVVQKQGGAIVAGLPLAARLENAIVSYCRYLGKLFWPVNLAAFYPPVGHWPGMVVVLCGLFLLAFSIVAIALRRRSPYCLVGWLWFLGTLVPVVGLIPAGEQSMADRYSYVPSVGILLLVVWGVHDLTKRWRYQALAASAATAGAALFCLVLTRAQISFWRNTEALFRHALLATDHNYVAHNNLGTALQKQGRWDEAINEFRWSLQVKPDYTEALNNLGVGLHHEGHVDEAIRQLEETLRLRPRYAVAHYNLGVALQERGQLDEAIAEYQAAVRLKPRYVDALYNLGLALQRQGDLGGAVAEFQAILKLQPNSPQVYDRLGGVLEARGQVDDAITQYRRALKLDPGYARAHCNLGVALDRQEQWDAAIAEFQEALRLEPDYAMARTNLALASEHKRKLDKK